MTSQTTTGIYKNLFYKFLIIIFVLNGLSAMKSKSVRQRQKRNFDLFNYNVEKMYGAAQKADASLNQQAFSVISLSEFVAKVTGGLKQAEILAKKYDLKLVRQVFKDSDYFLFEKEIVEDRSTDKNSSLSSNQRIRRSLETSEIQILTAEPKIEWIQEQVPLSRKKRDFVSFDDHFSHKSSMKQNYGEQGHFNDPMWSKLWYINQDPTGQSSTRQNTMRVKEAWKLGYTGKNVVVTILDDGLEWDHPDLIKNYDFRASLDINDGDNDPKPRYDRYNYNKHGTRCAGEIAAVADNNVCSIGVAYNSQIGGIRMLDGEVTDLVEATALSYNRDYIDIYSASWGPDDDGKTVDGPGYLALKAIEDGIKYGRRGLGSIYVWASGNGGKDDDNCNCDGYTNSIYTISVSSATQNGQIPWYSESCSSTIASTFSSGSYEERQIITTDLRKSCTEGHTGTSASAPLAAGIIALTLEANPELSWRDIQHIIVKTAKPDNLSSSDWHRNGVDFIVSHSFGFGLMDALAMVELAKSWTSVPHQRKCIIESSMDGKNQKPILIPRGDRLIIELYSTGCQGAKNEINFLEHVQAVISVQSNTRGTLVVYLRSPMGTNSTLLDRRMLDQSTESFNKWPFTTVHMWGERAQGTWILEIKNNAKNTTYLNLNLILYGTKEAPQKRSVKSHENDDPKNTRVDESTTTEVPKTPPLQNTPIVSNNKKNPQSFIDWTNLNGYKINDNFPFQFISQNRPGSRQETTKVPEKPKPTTIKPLQIPTNSIDSAYYFIASNKKKYDPEFTEVYPSSDYADSEEYIDYDHDYDVNNIKTQKSFASGEVLLAMLSTSMPIKQGQADVHESKIEAIVNNIHGTPQERQSAYVLKSEARSGAIAIKSEVLFDLMFFQLFYKILTL